ncbi:MAG: hypothetical protein MHM6MM_007571 [Cercozoa sp. M6MM]
MRVLLLLASLVLGVLAQVKQVDDSALHELVKEHPEISVLVAFTAPWCGHCKRLKPVWEKLDNKFADDDAVVVAEINAVENSYAAAQYGVRGFPTIKLVRNHEMLSFEGKRDVTTLAEFALAAHANKDWEPVPEPLTTTGLFLVEAKRMFGDVLVLIQTRVHVAIVLFAFGTVFGFMFGLVVAGSGSSVLLCISVLLYFRYLSSVQTGSNRPRSDRGGAAPTHPRGARQQDTCRGRSCPGRHQ